VPERLFDLTKRALDFFTRRLEPAVSVGPVDREVDELLVVRLREPNMACIALDVMDRRGTDSLGGNEAIVAEIARIGEASNGFDAVGDAAPKLGEDLAFVDASRRQFDADE